MKRIFYRSRRALTMALVALMGVAPALSTTTLASSHMDAPMITGDPRANTTDVYAFVSNDQSGNKVLTVALSVYPHENPGVGPNAYNFDDNVRYEIHVALGRDVAAGRPTITYRFDFDTAYKNSKTILVSYLDVINNINEPGQNLTQSYTIKKIDNRWGRATTIGRGIVPPNNQGNATPFYNQNNDGEQPARKGVKTAAELDRYTSQSIFNFPNGYTAFAGQRDDGFYADVQSIFDLLKLRNPGKDTQGGFNVHMMALQIPLRELGGDQQTVGVFATTSRPVLPVQDYKDDKDDKDKDDKYDRDDKGHGRALINLIRNSLYKQVARQGNPLFNEGLVALEDKDLYSRTLPTVDSRIFRKYAETPELASLINLLIGNGQQLAIPNGRTDLSAIYIPDLIKVDLSTDPVRLAGNAPDDQFNPDDQGFSRLGIFGGDILESRAQGHPFRLPSQFLGLPAGKFFVPGGWPNGRRFGEDPVDIAIIALLSDLRNPAALKINDPFRGNYDGVTGNEMGFNKVFPYEATPQNGRKIIGLSQ
ncbi:MAG TPA: DUF4331 domain-containing protein [Blastocatellia bacterium]|nr:DUF4331 domain-containing protein [Blastocatellia bacterium]